MYKVYQRALVVNEALQHELEYYQMCFHVEVYKYIFRFLMHRKGVKFNPSMVSDVVPKSSKYCVYQIAQRCYDTYMKHHTFQFERSSVWSANDVTIRPNLLYLKKNQEESLRIPYISLEKETYAFLLYPLKRVDIVRNGEVWSVNFLVDLP